MTDEAEYRSFLYTNAHFKTTVCIGQRKCGKHRPRPQALLAQQSQQINMYAAMREIVIERFRSTNYGHDAIQITLNRLIAAQKHTSFVLDNGVAVPHLAIESGTMPGVYVSWARSKPGVVFDSSEQEPVHIILCIIGEESKLQTIIARGLELTNIEDFRKMFIQADTRIDLRSVVKFALDKTHKERRPVKISEAREKTITKTCLITNRLGLHARAAAKLITMLNKFKSEIVIATDRGKVNGKSIMGTQMLAASRGTILTLQATGVDAEESMAAMVEMIENKFGESE